MPNWIEYVPLSGFKTDYMMLYAVTCWLPQNWSRNKVKQDHKLGKFSKKPFWGYELEYKSRIGAKPAPAWPMASQSRPF